jgi:hypothetical protein
LSAAFQAEYEGSIPFTRSKKTNYFNSLDDVHCEVNCFRPTNRPTSFCFLAWSAFAISAYPTSTLLPHVQRTLQTDGTPKIEPQIAGATGGLVLRALAH